MTIAITVQLVKAETAIMTKQSWKAVVSDSASETNVFMCNESALSYCFFPSIQFPV